MGNQTSKNNDIYDYNENEGKFTKKNQTITDLLTGGREILYERDLTINNINKLKEESNKTTLGKSDIDLLYQLFRNIFRIFYARCAPKRINSLFLPFSRLRQKQRLNNTGWERRSFIPITVLHTKKFRRSLNPVKENSEMKSMMMEVIKNGTTQNSHNTTTNSHNKAFNLNFFLNETCKDAMNITDFVESIKLQLSDLEKVGELGYVEGISNIIVKNLKDLDVTQRPVHCTDKKSETMYIKDEDKWEKDEERKKMHTASKNTPAP